MRTPRLSARGPRQPVNGAVRQAAMRRTTMCQPQAKQHRPTHPGVSPLRHRHRSPQAASGNLALRLRHQPWPVPSPPARTTHTPRRSVVGAQAVYLAHPRAGRSGAAKCLFSALRTLRRRTLTWAGTTRFTLPGMQSKRTRGGGFCNAGDVRRTFRTNDDASFGAVVQAGPCHRFRGFR